MLGIYHQFAFYIHIVLGSIALVVFWLPLLTKKGGKNHRLTGKIFVYSMYAVSISGVIMTTLVLFDPMAVRQPQAVLNAQQIIDFKIRNRIFSGFLFMLSVLVFTNVRQSILVLKAKKDRSLLKTPFHLLTISFLGCSGLIMGWIGFQQELTLFKVFAILSVLICIGMFRYIFKATIKKNEWIIEHLGNILGAGIGAYTAFFAFGGARFFSEVFTGSLQIVPWILPSIIGVAASTYLTKKYRKTYRII